MRSKTKAKLIGFITVFILLSTVVYVAGGTTTQNYGNTNKTRKGTKLLTGELKLPNGDVAQADIIAYVGVFPVEDTTHTALYSKKVSIRKGKKGAQYSIEIPNNKQKYGLKYELPGINDRESLLTTEIYDLEGYLCKKGMVSINNATHMKELLTFDMKNNVKLNLNIVPNKIVADGLKNILSKTVKPSMTDYEKEVAIYKYLVQNYRYDHFREDQIIGIPYYPKEYYTKNYSQIGLERVFVSKKAICGDYAKLMKLLLNKINIECELATGDVKSISPHMWNIVKLEGNYYQVDAARASEPYVTDEFSFLNYNDETYFFMIENPKCSNMPAYPKCDIYDYNYKFHKYWTENNLKIGDVKYLKGVVSLPNGRVAIDDETYIYVDAATGFESKEKQDDFKNSMFIKIPKGSSSAKFALPMVATNNNYRIYAQIGRGESLLDMKTIASNAAYSNDISLTLKDPYFIKGKISIPKGSKGLKWDIRICVYTKLDNGNQERCSSDYWNKDEFIINKDQKEMEFSIPVFQGDKPYILSYEILDKDDFPEYEDIAYFNEKQTTKSYELSTRIYTNETKIPLELTIVGK